MQTELSSLSFKISGLWTSAEGTSEKHDLDAELHYDPKEINTVSNLTGDLMLIKLKEEISALVTDAEIDVRLTCTKCLKEFTYLVSIPNAEREYYAKMPSKKDDINDIFLINMKDLTIDLTEMIRQEIILHFPFIAVCSKGCKGLCQTCGKDRNIRPCSCKVEYIDSHKPFKDLKKLLK